MEPSGLSSAITAGIVLAVLGLWAYCPYDFSRTSERDIRGFTRPVWILMLVFTGLFGSLLWLFYGRPQPPSRRGR